MLIKDLEKNIVIKELVNTIIEDKAFKGKCELNFKKIFEDGKVDRDDIPLIINLFLVIYKNQSKIKVSKKKLKPVFMLLISKLLVEFKGESDLDEEVILLLIEPQIDLLLMSVQFEAGKFPCCCCPAKPDDEKEENEVNKMKLNRIDKQKKLETEKLLK
tara:strand:- start:323 stop:799 length:477 start_codon:yes stop_codon:yes gene_type:complete